MIGQLHFQATLQRGFQHGFNSPSPPPNGTSPASICSKI
jgi:hypothetical protein